MCGSHGSAKVAKEDGWLCENFHQCMLMGHSSRIGLVSNAKDITGKLVPLTFFNADFRVVCRTAKTALLNCADLYVEVYQDQLIRVNERS